MAVVAPFIPYIMAGMSVAGTAVAMSAAKQQGDTAKDIARYNADTKRFQAKDALDRGVLAEDQQRAKVRQIRGAQMASLGASGLDPTTGTSGAVLDQTATMGELDAQTIRANAARQAWGYQNDVVMAGLEGDVAQQRAKNDMWSTFLTAGPRAYGVYKSAKG